ncbi:MAG: alanine--tRNA ligase [Chloroflexota bacterium]
MTHPRLSGAQIRQTFIDFFINKGHTFVPSASLVPGNDPTLLFTNAGMVQFKDIFLGTDKRAYTRATNSQKCMRVSGKHNDLEEVGFDDSHHTFFEMLGNWSFGDYYKKEAITWAWELLTEVWGLPKGRFWATCFEDEKGEIPRDDEASKFWQGQPGFDPDHVLFFGRKDNFWEMAETGPCGPCSEIHFDRGAEFCNKKDDPKHQCRVNGNCQRFLELWNLVFIQYNRLDGKHLEPLPATHVDTGMGFDRLTSLLQGTTSNYQTDQFAPLLDTTQKLTGHSDAEKEANFTPYRVIADHARAAAFLIADGVMPGNTGRNYICRMIIRRASRFGGKIGLHEPFLAKVCETVIQTYHESYPELETNKKVIFETINREEERFQRTIDAGTIHLEHLLSELKSRGELTLDGSQAFDLYATYGLPLEITRDIARENTMEVSEAGFHKAMEQHRIASGAGQALGKITTEDIDLFQNLLKKTTLGPQGVKYDPYGSLKVEGRVLALVQEGERVEQAHPGTTVAVLLPETCFYVEAGGQVSDTGTIVSTDDPAWEIRVDDMREPVSGIIVHIGEVIRGTPKVGDRVIAQVDTQRRRDIMRNHTATHLLHAQLRTVLGKHVRQAGSLVAPGRLRFDFIHPEALTPGELEAIEAGVNEKILQNHPLHVEHKSHQEAVSQGAMALFGEKYEETVRTISIGEDDTISYELCGGTHLNQTGDIGIFLILSESSVGSDLRRIEAVTGREAYNVIRDRFNALQETASVLNTSPEKVPQQVKTSLEEIAASRRQVEALRVELAAAEFERYLETPSEVISDIPVITAILPHANADTLRQMADRFRQRYPTGVVVLASVIEDRPILISAITQDLVTRGLHAGELVKHVAQQLGGGGGGRATLAQAGGNDASKLKPALASVFTWIHEKL